MAGRLRIKSVNVVTMDRRRFAKQIGLSAALIGMGGMTAAVAADRRPQVAITIDDFIVDDTPMLSGAVRNRAMLDVLRSHKLRVAVFVTGKYVEDKTKMKLLRLWDDGGHTIANHTYSHGYYPNADFDEYTGDILRNERLLEQLPRYRKLLRFPYLKEGKTAPQRDRMRAFLKEHGYGNGYVTIDASDWYIDSRLRKRLAANPKADVAAYRDFYLAHILDRATYYDDLARKVLGRNIKHTLLLHHNVLNGLFLGDLLRMFERRGWKLIDAEDAFGDPIFARAPNVLPAGESLIWSLAKETGKFDESLRYPAEGDEYEKAKMDALGM